MEPSPQIQESVVNYLVYQFVFPRGPVDYIELSQEHIICLFWLCCVLQTAESASFSGCPYTETVRRMDIPRSLLLLLTAV